MTSIPRIARLGLATALAACLTACDGPGATAPADAPLRADGLVLGSRVQGPRPLQGSLAGASVAGDPCSADPPGIIVTATARGVVTHLGATTLVLLTCVSVPDFYPLGPSTIYLTAANGDRIEGTVPPAISPTPVGFDFETEITGGTGRFARAGGHYTAHVVQAAPPEPFTLTLEGWIEY
jgi:hypothetical protein